jgi:hypothetical protein
MGASGQGSGLKATRHSSFARKLGRDSWSFTSRARTSGSSERRKAITSRRSSSDRFGVFTIQGGV